jgi:hypothetical protein
MKWYEILFWLIFALFCLNKAASIVDNYNIGVDEDEAVAVEVKK